MSAFLSLWFFLLPGYLPPGSGHCNVDIGEPAIPKCLHHKQACVVLTSPASIEPGIEFIANGIQYVAVVKRDKFSFIFTHDQKFKTPEGFTRATSFADLKAKRTAIIYLPGWGCAFDFEGEITDRSKILYFFKRAR